MKNKYIIGGYADSGKTSLGRIVNELYSITSMGSSELANELFIFDRLKLKYGYKTKEECFEDRVNHREEWFNLISFYNDINEYVLPRLALEIFNRYDMYLGIRNKEEFLSIKKLFNKTYPECTLVDVWIDTGTRVPVETGSNTLGKEDFTYSIDNSKDDPDLTLFTSNIFKFLLNISTKSHKYSVEQLYHFQCCNCRKWWSIGDYVPQPTIVCPHCKSESFLKEAEPLNLQT